MSATAAAGSEGHASVGLYVFCFARAGAAGAVEGHGVIGESSFSARVYEDVAAICCEVPLHE